MNNKKNTNMFLYKITSCKLKEDNHKIFNKATRVIKIYIFKEYW